MPYLIRDQYPEWERYHVRDIRMEDFGKRLKRERERLGLSQTKFAEACGVGKTAQFNYERGERVPSSTYMHAAAGLGVDIGYVFEAMTGHLYDAHFRSHSVLLSTLVLLLGLDENTQKTLQLQHVDLDLIPSISNPDQHMDSSDVKLGKWLDDVKKWLSSSRNPERCMDIELFTSVLASIEAQARKTGTDLEPERKSRAAVMIYRAAKASGSVDRRMLEDAVKLAAS